MSVTTIAADSHERGFEINHLPALTLEISRQID
jgi:hypothetical protein